MGSGDNFIYPHTPVDNSPPYGDNYPLPPVSPLIYDKMTEIGGTIPNTYLLKFSRKLTPLP